MSADRSGNRSIRNVFIPSCGALAHLKGYGWIKVCKTVGTNGGVGHWAAGRLEMTLDNVRSMPWTPGKWRAILAARSRSRASSERNFAPPWPNATLSVWSSVR